MLENVLTKRLTAKKALQHIFIKERYLLAESLKSSVVDDDAKGISEDILGTSYESNKM